MGWSCSLEAARVMERWSAACVASTGSSNEYEEDGKRYFFEASNREHEDGSVTGVIIRLGENGFGQKTGTFRIGGDGKVKRTPSFLRKA